MRVTACIVTRGNVDLQPVINSLPRDWEIVIWFNGSHVEKCPANWDERTPFEEFHGVPDLSVYGRYASIIYASHELIFVQDDDVIVNDPQAIVDAWIADATEQRWRTADAQRGMDEVGVTDHIVANMPSEFRHAGFTDSCLVGFGACFHREMPDRVFARWQAAATKFPDLVRGPEGKEIFNRACDVVFTTLSPCVLVDIPKEELASNPDRHGSPDGEREMMLELARMVRDG